MPLHAPLKGQASRSLSTTPWVWRCPLPCLLGCTQIASHGPEAVRAMGRGSRLWEGRPPNPAPNSLEPRSLSSSRPWVGRVSGLGGQGECKPPGRESRAEATEPCPEECFWEERNGSSIPLGKQSAGLPGPVCQAECQEHARQHSRLEQRWPWRFPQQSGGMTDR